MEFRRGDKIRVTKTEYPKEYKVGDIIEVIRFNGRENQRQIEAFHPVKENPQKGEYHCIGTWECVKVSLKTIVEILNSEIK